MTQGLQTTSTLWYWLVLGRLLVINANRIYKIPQHLLFEIPGEQQVHRRRERVINLDLERLHAIANVTSVCAVLRMHLSYPLCVVVKCLLLHPMERQCYTAGSLLSPCNIILQYGEYSYANTQ